MVTTDKAKNQALVRSISNCFDRVVYRQMQKLANIFNGLAIRSSYFFLGLSFFLRSDNGSKLSLLHISSVMAIIAIYYFCLAAFSQSHKFMRTAATNSTAISFYRAEIQTASGKYLSVGIIHFLIGYF